jgi:two-component system nitrate/nitrite response regulator NarL
VKSAIPVIVTHPITLVREGVGQLLNCSRFRPVHTAPEFDEAADRAITQLSGQPCVWLYGMEKCRAPDFSVLRHVSANRPDLTIVLLGDFYTSDEVLPALDAGASGFVGYDITRERLIKSLELIVLGEMVVPAQFLRAISARLSGDLLPCAPETLVALPSYTVTNELTTSVHERLSEETTCFAARLSSREIAILRLFMEGASNKLIARQLGITEATVKVHNKAILRKLRLQNRTQAAVWAHNHLNEVSNGLPLSNGLSDSSLYDNGASRFHGKE